MNFNEDDNTYCEKWKDLNGGKNKTGHSDENAKKYKWIAIMNKIYHD